MNHSIGWYVSILLYFLLACSEPVPPQAENKRPNVVLILTDDQGWGDLSLSGNTNLSTPNIDQIAARGVRFDRFYVAPVCSPTRAEILTGRYHPRAGVYSTSAGGERMDLDEQTIAEVFQTAGYRTAAFGKWHNGMQPPYHPNARGFDEYYGFCSGHWGHYFSPMLEHNGAIVKGNGFVIDDFTERAMAFMETSDQPFFVYLPYNTPHSPMQVPDRWWNKFKDKSLDMLHRDAEKEDQDFTRAALAMCENIDWNVGRVVQKLEALGQLDNTILLFLSDNGPNGNRWNDGMKGRKGSTDEGGVRSPLVMQWPAKIKPAQSIETIASSIDLLPTLTELAGLDFEPRKPLDGRSLQPLLLGKKMDWPDRILFSTWREKTSVRNQQYRLDAENQLFDLAADPGQRNDIAAQQPEVWAQLVSAKEEFVNTVLAELPEEDTRSFPIGHPDFEWTQVPARDAQWTGNIQRSNRWPNCSFLTNWKSTDDAITWEAEVLADGEFDVSLYYSCPASELGATIQLSFNEVSIQTTITEAHDPPLVGAADDRHPRMESYVKDFRQMNFGTIQLKQGKGTLKLQALEVPNGGVMDFRLLMFRRI
ncbi:MAG: arylsulfatase [Bacteroidota bacterium]